MSLEVSLVKLKEIYLIMDLEIEVPKSPRACNYEMEALQLTQPGKAS